MTDSHPENETPNAIVVASATSKEKIAWQTPHLSVMDHEAVLAGAGSPGDGYSPAVGTAGST